MAERAKTITLEEEVATPINKAVRALNRVATRLLKEGSYDEANQIDNLTINIVSALVEYLDNPND